MTVIYGILLVLLLVPLAIVTTDYISNKWNNLKRFHIGRWQSQEQWQQAVKNTACKWLAKTPVVKKTDQNSYLLLDWIRKNNYSSTIQSWQKAGLILGLQCMKDTKCHDAIKVWKNTAFDGSGMWKEPVAKVDSAMLAYAALKTESDPNRIRTAMDWTVKVLEENLCEDGMISYSQGKHSKIRFVDTLGMVCPFLAMYGKTYKDDWYVQLAYHQLERYRLMGLYPGTQLPCHAVSTEENLPLGIFGWGRGTLWYLLALADTYEELPEDARKQNVQDWIASAAKSCLKYQKEDGGFHTILQGGGQYDSSVTAGMAFFYREAARILQIEEYDVVADKCIARLMKVTMRNGAVDQCQGDTHGIGIFSQVYDVMPFVQGLVLRALKP